MKIWLVICVLVSAVIVGVQVHKMRSNVWSFYVSPGGHLKSPDGPAGAIYDWNYLHGLKARYALPQPGDELELEHVRSKLPVLKNLEYQTLKVVRDKRHVAYFKSGQVEFYAAFVAVAALPFLILGIVFAFLRLTPQRQPEPI